MTNISWWRSWHGAPTDHKWAVIAARANVKVGIVSAVAWALLDHASQHKERGTVSDFDTEVYAVYSGFDETEIVAVIKAMNDKGIITEGRLTNWEKRQPKREDDSAERVRRFRAMKHNVTQSNTPDTDTDTDTDTDKELSMVVDETVARVSTFYSDNFSAITQFTAEDILDWCKEYQEAWIMDAMKIAVRNNVRKINYVDAILKDWKANGKDDGTPRKNSYKNDKQAKRDELYALLQEE